MGEVTSLVPPEARALLGCFFFAGNQILVRRLVDRASALTVTVWVNLTMGILALGLSPLGDSYQGDIFLAFLFFFGVGLVGNGVARYSAYRSSQVLGVSRTNAMVAASPIGAALTGIFFLGERPGTAVWAGTGLVVLGLVFLTMERRAGRSPLGDHGFAFLALFAFSFTPFLRKGGLQIMNAPWMGIAISTTVANFFLLASSRYMPAAQQFRATLPVFLGSLPAGVLGLGSAINFWTALRDGSLTVISPLIRMTPIFVILLSALFLRGRERITGRLVVGTLIVVAGAALVTSGR